MPQIYVSPKRKIQSILFLELLYNIRKILYDWPSSITTLKFDHIRYWKFTIYSILDTNRCILLSISLTLNNIEGRIYPPPSLFFFACKSDRDIDLKIGDFPWNVVVELWKNFFGWLEYCLSTACLRPYSGLPAVSNIVRSGNFRRIWPIQAVCSVVKSDTKKSSFFLSISNRASMASVSLNSLVVSVPVSCQNGPRSNQGEVIKKFNYLCVQKVSYWNGQKFETKPKERDSDFHDHISKCQVLWEEQICLQRRKFN